jgi:hypothetical protein
MEPSNEQVSFHLHEFLTSSANLSADTIQPNGEYHLLKIHWPLRPVDDPNRHPDLSVLRRRIGAHHFNLLLCASPAPRQASGRMYDIGYARKSEHPDGQLILLGDDPVPADGLGGEGPKVQYIGCLGAGRWFQLCHGEAERLLDERDWIYHLETFNCETFVDSLAERLVTLGRVQNRQADLERAVAVKPV